LAIVRPVPHICPPLADVGLSAPEERLPIARHLSGGYAATKSHARDRALSVGDGRSSARAKSDGHKTRQPLPFRSRAMKICIIGCGAVGSLFAAHLAGAGKAEVCAYDVSQPHVDAINARGLRLSGAADFTSRLRASSDAKD